jgi:hypothetical protein
VETQSHGLFTPIIPLGEIGKASLRLDDDADAARQPQSPYHPQQNSLQQQQLGKTNGGPTTIRFVVDDENLSRQFH